MQITAERGRSCAPLGRQRLRALARLPLRTGAAGTGVRPAAPALNSWLGVSIGAAVARRALFNSSSNAMGPGEQRLLPSAPRLGEGGHTSGLSWTERIARSRMPGSAAAALLLPERRPRSPGCVAGPSTLGKGSLEVIG